MSVTADAIRHKFIVQAQRNAEMTIEEAEALGDFFASIGEHMLSQLTPMLTDYKNRITEHVRTNLIDELVLDIQTSPGPLMTKASIVAKLRAHQRNIESNQNGTNANKR